MLAHLQHKGRAIAGDEAVSNLFFCCHKRTMDVHLKPHQSDTGHYYQGLGGGGGEETLIFETIVPIRYCKNTYVQK